MAFVFISYSRKDSAMMAAIRQFFIENGIEYWVDVEGIEDVSVEWRPEIVKALEECAAILVLMSLNSYFSPWVQREIATGTELGKKFIPVLIEDDKIPFDLRTLGRIDLRDGLEPLKLNELLTNVRSVIRSVLKPVETPPVVAEIRPDHLASNPIPMWTMHLVREHLKDIVEKVRRVSKATWRGSLLWFHKEAWYVAAESGRYQDDELRLWMNKGQGFAGTILEKGEVDVPYHSFYPKRYKLGRLQTLLKLTKRQAEITARMGTIICFPVVDRTSNPAQIVGMLSIDSNIRRELPEDTLASIRTMVISLESIIEYTPLPYKCFRGLSNILRVARLVPPLDAPTRAGIYWEHTRTKKLYLIVGSERDITAWSTNAVNYDRKDESQAENIIWQAWTTGQVCYADGPTAECGVALPITAPDGTGGVMGVLYMACERKAERVNLSSQQPFFEELVRLAAKVLESRDGPWDD
jgi:hypothetical protein